jgi:hypothetical protein
MKPETLMRSFHGLKGLITCSATYSCIATSHFFLHLFSKERYLLWRQNVGRTQILQPKNYVERESERERDREKLRSNFEMSWSQMWRLGKWSVNHDEAPHKLSPQLWWDKQTSRVSTANIGMVWCEESQSWSGIVGISSSGEAENDFVSRWLLCSMKSHPTHLPQIFGTCI